MGRESNPGHTARKERFVITKLQLFRVKLENFVEIDNMDIDLYPHKREDKWYQNARDCVLLHKHIIEFAQILEDANTTSYLLQLGFNMICVSFTQYQAVVNLTDTAIVIRYASVTICLLCDLLFVSWPGQQLSDSTERIFEYTTNGKWCQSSIPCRKLLMLMLSKSIKPMKLTACNLYTLNLESFSAVRFIFYHRNKIFSLKLLSLTLFGVIVSISIKVIAVNVPHVLGVIGIIDSDVSRALGVSVPGVPGVPGISGIAEGTVFGIPKVIGVIVPGVVLESLELLFLASLKNTIWINSDVQVGNNVIKVDVTFCMISGKTVVKTEGSGVLTRLVHWFKFVSSEGGPGR
ncbi:PREDICTED: uncharacterized protein LOC108546105 [Eufriesea mexicana]|uniref:uncharacterized protein LOC108546105 n=1 Tax=Eufriesea mexicana TaxID=516756 RepID=UPI00083BB129|nr:PREDICTED: uncharacterized protein LOC108546105 [Eufriesea mexicana]